MLSKDPKFFDDKLQEFNQQGRITPDYTLAFEFLTKWMPLVNSTFEPENNGSVKRQEEVFTSSHPVVLDIAREIGTFWKHNKELIWLPNIKQGFFGIVQLTAEEVAMYK